MSKVEADPAPSTEPPAIALRAIPGLGQRVLAADVEVGLRGADGEPLDRHRLDDRERVLLHEDAVLERAGLRLVGVADDVVGWAGWPATAAHLRPVGKAAPPRPTSPELGDLVDDRLGPPIASARSSAA